jgi:hypothetical protein
LLKQAEAGAKTKDLCRKHGISQAMFYNLKGEVRRADDILRRDGFKALQAGERKA